MHWAQIDQIHSLKQHLTVRSSRHDKHVVCLTLPWQSRIEISHIRLRALGLWNMTFDLVIIVYTDNLHFNGLTPITLCRLPFLYLLHAGDRQVMLPTSEEERSRMGEHSLCRTYVANHNLSHSVTCKLQADYMIRMLSHLWCCDVVCKVLNQSYMALHCSGSSLHASSPLFHWLIWSFEVHHIHLVCLLQSLVVNVSTLKPG